MAIRCGECGTRVASRAALAGHFRRAHAALRRRPERTIVRERPTRLDAPRAIQGEIVDVAPIGHEIVPARRESAPPRTVLATVGDEPEWYRREFPQDAARCPWRERDEENREFYRKAHAAIQGVAVRRPDAPDAVILLSQYHALKALATRLDAGIATERERVAFEAGLREYNLTYDHVSQKLRDLT